MAECEKVNDLVNELTAVKKDVERLDNSVLVVKKRLTLHGQEIDNLSDNFKEFKTDVELIKQSMGFMQGMLSEIKTDVKQMRMEREEDHYKKPLAKNERFVWQVVSILIAVIIGFMVKMLFPMI